MVTLFHDMMHKEVEVYMDDMIMKSRTPDQHVEDLRKLLNLAKCTFGVKVGKLLGFIVNEKGIQVDSDKIKAIWNMPTPKTETDVQGFLGRVNYIARFISQLTATCSPIFKLLQKNQKMERNEECQEAFEKVKQYLETPPILVLAVLGKPLILYPAMLEESMGCVLGQLDASRKKEQAIYYLTKKLTDCE
ncbi:Tf2-6, partial [Mucuna pruriens]